MTTEDFDDFFRATWPRLFRTAYAVAGDAGSAEDALQAAYARAFARWGHVSSTEHPEAYVRRMVVNEVLGTRRRGWWKRERPHHDAEPPGAHDGPEPGVVAAGTALVLVLGGGSGADRGARGLDPVGQLDFSHGLRAYADPGFVIHLGGREFPARDLDYLDTDATATPYGVVFYDDGHPMLLEESGEFRDLEPGASGGGGHPTAKVDSRGALVAYAVGTDDGLEVVVRDLASDDVLGRHTVPHGTVIDALDDGVVFLRTGDGTTSWDAATGRVEEVAGPRTRVADVRNGVLLYDGPRPDGPDATRYRLVDGAIDAQLTYDGSHVLSWSSTLESTDGGAPIVLDQEATFFAIDTDGSILAAQYGHPATVYDCEVPSGTCTELGPLTTKGGDPAFVGVDM